VEESARAAGGQACVEDVFVVVVDRRPPYVAPCSVEVFEVSVDTVDGPSDVKGRAIEFDEEVNAGLIEPMLKACFIDNRDSPHVSAKGSQPTAWRTTVQKDETENGLEHHGGRDPPSGGRHGCEPDPVDEDGEVDEGQMEAAHDLHPVGRV
jgi:hypothetical protein